MTANAEAARWNDNFTPASSQGERVFSCQPAFVRLFLSASFQTTPHDLGADNEHRSLHNGNPVGTENMPADLNRLAGGATAGGATPGAWRKMTACRFNYVRA